MKLSGYIGILLYKTLGNLLPGFETGKIGRIGKTVRRFCFRMIMPYVGIDTEVGRHVRFSRRICLGNHSSIGNHCYLQGEIHIGENVMIAPYVTLLATNHNYMDTNVPMNKQGSVDMPIIIDDDVWIAQGATILSGVHIETGAVIGAASVVTKDVPAYTVVAGNPAKPIKMRK